MFSCWHLTRAKVIYQECMLCWRNPDQKCCAVWCRDWAMTPNQRPGEILTDQWGARDDVTQIRDVGVAEEAQAANWEHLTPGDTDQWEARTVSQWPMRGQWCAEDDAARVRGSLAALLTPNIQTGCTNNQHCKFWFGHIKRLASQIKCLEIHFLFPCSILKKWII